MLSFVSSAMTLLNLNSPTPPLPEMNLYQYWVRIPPTELSCPEEAKRFAERFHSATHIPVDETVCRGTVETIQDGIPVKLYSLMITYRAEMEARPLVTSFEPGYSSSLQTPKAAYATYAECLADLPKQSVIFANQTQLAPVTAFCDVSQTSLQNGYALQLHGFGEPVSTLSVFVLDFEGATDLPTQTEARRLIESQGATVVRDLGTTLYYYSKAPLPVRHTFFGTFTTRDQCTSQEDVARSIYLNAGSKNTLARCLPSRIAGFSLNVLGDGSGFLFGQEYLGATYYSFDECMGDRSRILAERQRNGNPVFGAICKSDLYQENRFKMFLYHY